MKILLSIICALCTFIYVQNVSSSALLGAKECTWGPSYWCKNLTNAHNCGAVSHCIQTVWEHQNEKGDNDSVCKICKDMVKEARDQLESNETQEELKEVFEGSCKLIPIKVINQECIKLADDFIPDLVETLASQMNPEVVCSVAGLCNNERYDKLIAEEKAKHPKPASLADDIHVNDCSGCYTVMDKIEAKFSNLNENDFLNELLMVCGNMGSFSDACANIMVKYFDEIYGTLKRDLNSKSVCHISGMCSAKFHQHPELDSAVEIIPHGSTGLRPVDDDLPCDLCSQLVGHLRDLLIANTTESEFQQVLEGLCKQTNSFKAECLNIVDEYYPRIYYVLVNELKPQEVCVMAGLCPRPKGLDAEVPIWPLLQDDTIKNSKIVTKVLESQNNKELIGNDEANSYGNNERLLTDDEIQSAQLPIDRILPGSLLGAQSSQVCSLCEYALHYIQTELSDSRTEDEIKHVVESMCDKLPRSVNKECDGFVETYGDAVIAILAQEIDPSQVCPMLSLCPKQDTKDIEILIQSNANGQRGKSNCPLCLFAVKQLEDMVKDQKTEASIEHALDTLCETLPKDLSKECDDFVATYSHELIEMLIADLEPQEVCVYLKLCDPKDSDIVPPRTPIITFNDINNGGDILTNEIPDMTVGGQVIPTHKKRANVEGGGCVLCKMVVDEVLKALNGSVNPDDIKHAFHEVCSVFSSPDECNKFVATYIDYMIDLIAKHVDGADICSLLPVCTEEAIQIKSHVTDCVICEEVVFSIHMMLKNPHVDHDIEHLLKKACSVLPETRLQQCSNLMDIYGKMIIDLLERETNSRTVCKKLAICGANPFYTERHVTVKRQAKEELLGAKKCTWGPSYWCDTLEKANECNALEHCRSKVWKSDSPPIKSK